MAQLQWLGWQPERRNAFAEAISGATQGFITGTQLKAQREQQEMARTKQEEAIKAQNIENMIAFSKVMPYLKDEGQDYMIDIAKELGYDLKWMKGITAPTKARTPPSRSEVEGYFFATDPIRGRVPKSKEDVLRGVGFAIQSGRLSPDQGLSMLSAYGPDSGITSDDIASFASGEGLPFKAGTKGAPSEAPEEEIGLGGKIGRALFGAPERGGERPKGLLSRAYNQLIEGTATSLMPILHPEIMTPQNVSLLEKAGEHELARTAAKIHSTGMVDLLEQPVPMSALILGDFPLGGTEEEKQAWYKRALQLTGGKK